MYLNYLLTAGSITLLFKSTGIHEHDETFIVFLLAQPSKEYDPYMTLHMS